MAKNRGRLINMNQGNNVQQGQKEQQVTTPAEKPQEQPQATQPTQVEQQPTKEVEATQEVTESVTEEAQTQEQQQEQNEPQDNDSDAGSDISSILDEVTAKSSVKFNKTQVSIYLDDDVYKKYQRFGKKFGKGSRSNLINELLRKALEEY